jgi:hypothetical protein
MIGVQTKPNQILAEQEAKVADLRKTADRAVRLFETEEAVLRGMRLMLETQDEPGMGSLFGPSRSASVIKHYQAVVDSAARRGRQPGAISHQWRNALGNLHKGFPGGFTIAEVVGAAHHAGLPNVKDRDAEERMRSYLELGYVERVDGGFRVSELAANKYVRLLQRMPKEPHEEFGYRSRTSVPNSWETYLARMPAPWLGDVGAATRDRAC